MRNNPISKNVEKNRLTSMFNHIAPHYDFLNHFLSLGIDTLWRKKALRNISDIKDAIVLDVASGTADFALETSRLYPQKTVGIDLSNEMLKRGMTKIKQRNMHGWINLLTADSESLPFKKASFDAVICAFGARNFSNLDNALLEMGRVLKPDGKMVVLEFSRYKKNLQGSIIRFCFQTFIPIIGGLLSANPKAYHYLPQSIGQFLSPQEFQSKLEKTGFKSVKVASFSFGIVSVYSCRK
jgi:demethylmenaquinone methyltransferase/2-methoxy-6-polyprenyl-1,4-benzoquinol methylase